MSRKECRSIKNCFLFSKCAFRSYTYAFIYKYKRVDVCVCVGEKKGHCVRIATKAPNVIFHTHPYLKTPLRFSGNNTTTTSGVKSLKFIPAG